MNDLLFKEYAGIMNTIILKSISRTFYNHHDALWESKNQLKKDKENTSLHNTCVQEQNCMAGHGTFVH